MARQRRINEPGSYHHITARGVDRCDVFLDDQDRRQFLSLLSEARRRYGCRILAFCLMTNHVHLSVFDQFGTLSKTQHLLNGVYAKRFNHRHARTGHLFERRFWSSVLDSDAYLATCVAYIHRNPVEAGLAGAPQDYRWSSYSSYLGFRPSPDFLDTSTVLERFGNDLDRLRFFTEHAAHQDPVFCQLRSANPPPVIGPARDSRSAGPSAPPSLGPVSLIPLEEIVAVCACVFDVDRASLRHGTRGRPNPARGLAALVAQRYVGHSLKDIADALGFNSPTAASAASVRFARSLARRDQGLDAALDLVLQTLGLDKPSC